jgi:chlorobactene glucosyltransferase
VVGKAPPDKKRPGIVVITYFTQDLILHLIIFQIATLLIFASNILIANLARQHSPPLTFPMVSILVPARNEERNIARCVQSLLAFDYPAFELIVLDDQSRDNTRAILETLSRSHSRLQVLDGDPPSGSQIGKSWACSQLARRAQGELLFFTDADTLHQPETLRTIVTAIEGEQADLLTGFPCQEVQTWGERFLVPFFSWAMLCFVPLALAYRLSHPALSGALGQMMLFRREAYLAIGGHEAVASSIVDDLTLVRRLKSHGMRWRVISIADLISCRMYHNSREAFNGFAKNLFAAFDFRLLPFLLVFTWLVVMFWEPLIVLLFMILGLVPHITATYLYVCIGLSIILWLLPYVYMGIPFGLALLYPITILAIEFVALTSLRKSLGAKLSWKDRPIAGAHWKWI